MGENFQKFNPGDIITASYLNEVSRICTNASFPEIRSRSKRLLVFTIQVLEEVDHDKYLYRGRPLWFNPDDEVAPGWEVNFEDYELDIETSLIGHVSVGSRFTVYFDEMTQTCLPFISNETKVVEGILTSTLARGEPAFPEKGTFQRYIKVFGINGEFGLQPADEPSEIIYELGLLGSDVSPLPVDTHIRAVKMYGVWVLDNADCDVISDAAQNSSSSSLSSSSSSSST